jgi:hypothetical protein
VAVFPDRIILKNSTDAQAAIESAIGSGGTDEIQQGELVIGREEGSAKLYTVDSTGAIVTISGGGGGSATLGRGDGGDIDGTTVDSAFVFGVWGGGDLDTTTEDKPIELVVIGMADGGDIT